MEYVRRMCNAPVVCVEAVKSARRPAELAWLPREYLPAVTNRSHSDCYAALAGLANKAVWPFTEQQHQVRERERRREIGGCDRYKKIQIFKSADEFFFRAEPEQR